jgi:hypothetical protein
MKYESVISHVFMALYKMKNRDNFKGNNLTKGPYSRLCLVHLAANELQDGNHLIETRHTRTSIAVGASVLQAFIKLL